MTYSELVGKHLHQVYFGGNWTERNLKQVLSEVSYTQAKWKIEGYNTIASLMYHVHYYVHHVSLLLQGKGFHAKDNLSWETPSFETEDEWNEFLEKAWEEAARCSELISGLSEDELKSFFIKEDYGSTFSNLIGIIEHIHYHMAQMVFILKLIKKEGAEAPS